MRSTSRRIIRRIGSGASWSHSILRLVDARWSRSTPRPPDSVALEAVEWMELQAMKAGRRARDEALIDRLLDKRRKAIAASTSAVDTVGLLDALAADFQDLRDVSNESRRATELMRQPE